VLPNGIPYLKAPSPDGCFCDALKHNDSDEFAKHSGSAKSKHFAGHIQSMNPNWIYLLRPHLEPKLGTVHKGRGNTNGYTHQEVDDVLRKLSALTARGHSHREPREASIVDTYKYMQEVLIYEYYRKKHRFLVMNTPDLFVNWIVALLKLMLDNARKALKAPTLFKEEDVYTCVEDYNYNPSGRKVPHPKYKCTLKEPLVQSLVELIFTRISIHCNSVDKASNNPCYQCPYAASRALLNQTIPTHQEIIQYTTLSSVEEMTTQGGIDIMRLSNLRAIKKPAAFQTTEIDKLKVALDYVANRVYNGYKFIPETPLEVKTRTHTETSTAGPFLNLFHSDDLEITRSSTSCGYYSGDNKSGSESEDDDVHKGPSTAQNPLAIPNDPAVQQRRDERKAKVDSRKSLPGYAYKTP
jgi:hypothetical protein